MGLCRAVRRGAKSNLQLGQGEAAAGAHAAVVLDCRAANDGAELVDGARGDGGGLGDAGGAATVLAAGLSESQMEATMVLE